MKKPVILAFVVLALAILACGSTNLDISPANPQDIPVDIVTATPLDQPAAPVVATASQDNSEPSIDLILPPLDSLSQYRLISQIGFICLDLINQGDFIDFITREYNQGDQVNPCYEEAKYHGYQETKSPPKYIYYFKIDQKGVLQGEELGPEEVTEAEYLSLSKGDIIACIFDGYFRAPCDYLHPIRP